MLSGKTCEELELISIKRELLVNSVSDVKGLTKDAILQEHNCSVTFKNVLEVAVSC